MSKISILTTGQNNIFVKENIVLNTISTRTPWTLPFDTKFNLGAYTLNSTGETGIFISNSSVEYGNTLLVSPEIKVHDRSSLTVNKPVTYTDINYRGLSSVTTPKQRWY
jgi:hypothetical protein